MTGKLIKMLALAALLSGVVWAALALVKGARADSGDGELYGDYDSRDARGVSANGW